MMYDDYRYSVTQWVLLCFDINSIPMINHACDETCFLGSVLLDYVIWAVVNLKAKTMLHALQTIARCYIMFAKRLQYTSK